MSGIFISPKGERMVQLNTSESTVHFEHNLCRHKKSEQLDKKLSAQNSYLNTTHFLEKRGCKVFMYFLV